MLESVLKCTSPAQVIMTPTALETIALTDDREEVLSRENLSKESLNKEALSMAFLEAGIKMPPTQYDLPCSDGDKMETFRHKLQMDILIETLQPWLRARSDGFVGGDMFVYYSLEQVKNKDFKGPDFYAAIGVPKGERLSWVCWEEGKSPDVVIELLSPSTAKYDKTKKKDIYQDSMKVNEYYWYNPFDSNDFKGFQMQSSQYQELQPNAQGNLTSHALGLQLVRWEGVYYDIAATWLRWAYPDGTLIPSREELWMAAEANATQAQTEAAQAQRQVQQIVENLKASGMDVAQISIVTGLPIEEIIHPSV